ncbi:glycoside hydrolase superfamily [Mycena crocata]|nr:glycoside hydrolase superfamily [Mycena crocata]
MVALGLLVCAKHYIAYKQETFCNPYNLTEEYTVFPPLEQTPISSNFGDRAAHEPLFAEAITAGPGDHHVQLNEINQTHACADDHTLNHLLKGELGFQGSVISDWGGTWDTAASGIGGLDISMPGTAYDGLFGKCYGDELTALVKNGILSEARLDNMPSFDVHDLTIATNNVRWDHYKVIRTTGEEAITLVKNNHKSGSSLPFPVPASMTRMLLPLYGATSCGDGGTVCPIKNNGTLAMRGGSSWAHPPYTIDPLTAINVYVRVDGPDINQHLEHWDLAAAALQASCSKTALLFINAYAKEGGDRHNLTSYSNGDALCPGGKLHRGTAHRLQACQRFDAKNITPRYEFGFGMSYTTFKYGNLSVVQTFKADKTSIQPTAEAFVQQSHPGNSMYNILYTATIKVTNTGEVQGAEVYIMVGFQPVYDEAFVDCVQFPDSEDQPQYLLRGSDKLDLVPGKSKMAMFELTQKDLSVWDVYSQ